MPAIFSFKCDSCGFSLHSGWGGYTYVENECGDRIICVHPLEFSKITEVLGEGASVDLILNRTGFNSYCVCIDCLYQFEADFGEKDWWNSEVDVKNNGKNGSGITTGKDQRRCPKCSSEQVKTVREMVNRTCPKCNKGTIRENCTGIT